MMTVMKTLKLECDVIGTNAKTPVSDLQALVEYERILLRHFSASHRRI